MPKISDLPPLPGPLTGAELVIANQGEGVDEVSGTATIGGLVDAAVAPAVAEAAASAASVTASAMEIKRHSLELGLPVEATNLVPTAGSVSPSRFKSVAFIEDEIYIWRKRLRANPIRYANALMIGGGGINLLVDLITGEVGTGPGGFPNIATSTIERDGAFWLWTIIFVPTASTSGNWQTRPTTGAFPYDADGEDGLLVEFVELTTGGGANLLPNTTMLGGDWSSTSLEAPAAVTPTTDDTDLLGRRFNLTEAQSAASAQRLNGTMTGTRLTEDEGDGLSVRAFRSITVPADDTFRLEVEFKQGERKRLSFFSNVNNVFDVDFNGETGTAVGAGASIDMLDNGWYRGVYEAVSASSTAFNWQVQMQNDAGQWPFDGDGVSGLFVHRARVVNITTGQVILDTTTWDSGWTLNSCEPTPGAEQFGGIPYGLGATSSSAHPLAGIKGAMLGTSLVAQNIMPPAFAAETGCDLQVLGVSGGALGVDARGSPHAGSGAITALFASIDVDVKFVMLDMLVNDVAASDVPLGVVTDTTTATYCGALANFFNWCETNRPDAAVVVVVQTAASPVWSPSDYTHGHANANGDYLEDFQNATRRMCDYYGRPFIDPSRFGVGFLDMETGEDTADGLHWDASGAVRIAKIYAKQTRELAEAGWLPA